MAKNVLRARARKAGKVALPVYAGPDMPPRQFTRLATYAELHVSDVAGVAAAARATDDFLRGRFARTGAPACREGCAHCCTTHVSVTIPEVIAVVEALERLPADVAKGVRERLRANASAVAGKAPEDYPALPCAFLERDRCLVYGARPLKCRSAHSLEVMHCEKRSPEGIPRDAMAEAYAVAAYVGYLEALETAARDASSYELQQTAHLLLEHRKHGSRWRQGEPVFANARSKETSVADQLAELDERFGGG